MLDMKDSYVFLPLLLGIIVHGAVCYCLLILYKKESRSKFTGFLAVTAGLTALSCLVALFVPVIMILVAGILLAGAIALVACVIKLKAENENQEEKPSASTAAVPDELTADEEHSSAKVEKMLINVSRDFIINAADTLSGDAGLNRLLDYINQSLIKQTGAGGGVIFLVDDFEDIITAKSFYGDFPPPYKLPEDLPHKPVRVETNFRYAQFNLGETIFGEVAFSGKPELIEDGSMDSRIFQNGPEQFLQCGSYIVVPMTLRDVVIGVAAVARKAGEKAFTPSDFETAQVLTDFASAAIKNVYTFQEMAEHSDLTKESEVACKIQKNLHPRRMPALPGVSLGAFFIAAEGVCGDYYDIIPARKDRVALVIADVAGKGMNSVIIMIMIRAILQLIVNSTQNTATILDWVNRGITGKINMDHYATLALVNYNSVNKTLEYANAGHNSLYIWHSKTGKGEAVHINSDPIGVERTTGYSQLQIPAVPGDIIVLYSDGIIEALNSEGLQYGAAKLAEIISGSSELTAKDIANKVKKDIQDFIGSVNQHDDQTLLVMKIQG